MRCIVNSPNKSGECVARSYTRSSQSRIRWTSKIRFGLHDNGWHTAMDALLEAIDRAERKGASQVRVHLKFNRGTDIAQLSVNWEEGR